MKKILLILLLSTPLLAQSWLSTDLWKLGSGIITPVGNYNIGLAGGSLYLGYTADPTSGNKFAVNGASYFNGNATFAGNVSATNLTLTGIVTITSVSYSVTAIDAFIKANATSNAITVNLPAVSTSTGREITIKKIDSSANIVTLDANGSETIDGSTTKTITLQYESATIVCDGTSWLIK